MCTYISVFFFLLCDLSLCLSLCDFFLSFSCLFFPNCLLIRNYMGPNYYVSVSCSEITRVFCFVNRKKSESLALMEYFSS